VFVTAAARKAIANALEGTADNLNAEQTAIIAVSVLEGLGWRAPQPPYECSHGHTHPAGEACPVALAMQREGL
jgi:hypothetical protein